MKKKYKRLQFDFSEKSVSRLDKIVEETDSKTRAEVVRNALKLFDLVTSKYRAGYSLKLVKDNETIDVLPIIF